MNFTKTTALTVVLIVLFLCRVNGYEGNKFTKEQPFPGKVVAVKSEWVGYLVLIQNEKKEEYCIATIWTTVPIEYKRVDSDWAKQFIDGSIQLTPPVDIQRFSWCMDGLHTLGKQFGENDLLEEAKKNQK